MFLQKCRPRLITFLRFPSHPERKHSQERYLLYTETAARGISPLILSISSYTHSGEDLRKTRP